MSLVCFSHGQESGPWGTKIRALADGWTIVTADHSLSAQWEHTVLVTREGHEVLTTSPGAPPPPAP
mgnify:CR=1 FL=1